MLAQNQIHRTERISPARIVREVRMTTNHRIFHIHRLNRPINPQKLTELIRSIEKKNCLADFPIIISSQFDVLDGQHRLKAAEYLGVPIYYIFAIETTIADTSHVNGSKSPWNAEDHLHYYCEAGNESYKALRAFMQKWDHVPLRVAINLTSSRSGNANESVMTVFKAGEYVCSTLDFAEQVASASLDFARWFKFHRQQGFIFAVAKCVRNPNYDHKRMMQKMDYLSIRLVRCSRATEYLEKLEEIYNHKVQTENRVWLTKQ